MEFIRIRIGDTTLLNLIEKFLKAGYVDDGILVKPENGTPQGSLCKALHNPPYAKQVIMQSNLQKSP